MGDISHLWCLLNLWEKEGVKIRAEVSEVGQIFGRELQEEKTQQTLNNTIMNV